MKKLLLVFVVLLGALSFTQEAEAQNITVTGCGGAAGTYTGNAFGIPNLWQKSSTAHYIENTGGLNWRIRNNGGTTLASITGGTSNNPPSGAWTGSCGTANVSGPGTVAPAAACNITHTGGPLTQTVCVGVPITPLTFSTVSATNVSTGNMPPGVSASFSGNATAGTITVSGTPTSIPTSPPYNPSLFVTATGGTCTGTNTVNFTINLNPAPTISGASSVVLGSTITLTASSAGMGGAPWSSTNGTGSTSVSPSGVVTGLTAGTSTITFTAINGCTDTRVVTVLGGPTASVLSSGSGSNSYCAGGSGSANLSVAITGGVGPYSVVLTDGSTPFTTTGYTSGANISVSPTSTSTYSIVSVTDANSLVGTGNSGSATVTVFPAPSAAASVSSLATCVAGGSATVTPSGGTPGYTYLWSNPGATVTQTATGLAAGGYTATVTDANGCTATSSVTISTTPNPSVSISVDSNATCAVGGGATATGSGGTGPYSYSWSNGATTQGVTGIASGSYTVTVTDANGCTATSSVSISMSPNPSVSMSVDSNATCAVGGGATATGSGGTGPYSYSWSNGATTQSITGVASGSYTVTVTDANSCTVTSSVSISMSPNPSASIAVDSSASCLGGGATVTPSGGTGPYTFAWSNSAVTQSITGVAAGSYTVTVTDANSCTTTSSVTISPLLPSVSTAVDNDATCGLFNGGATATGSGGTGPYTYAWSNSATTPSITGLPPGTYTVTITDAKTCTATSSVSIAAIAVPSVSAAVDSNATCGLNNGGATATPSSGVPPYNYAWSNFSVTPSITGVAAATYSVTVTDANSCTATSSVTISAISLPSVSASVDSIETCAVGGGATASGSGGTTPYSYSWSNGATTQSITGVASGSYTVTVTDANGCTATSSVSISSAPNPSVSIAVDSIATCAVGGGATATGSGGTGPYTYAWSNSATTASITGVAMGSYTVTVTDANSCTATSSVSIAITPNPSISVAVDSIATCAVGGGATAAGSGGTGPYTYAWSNSATTASITGVASGSYSVTVTDANSCTATSSVSIGITPNPSVSVSVDSNETCNVGGGATATGSGGTGPYTYAWSNSATTASITGVASGSYTVTVTDANSCTSSSSVSIAPAPPINVTATPSSSTVCLGAAVGSSITASGATSYSWSPATGLNTTTGATVMALPTATTTYTVTGTDGICSATTTVLVNVASIDSLVLTASPQNICVGGNSSLMAMGCQTVSATQMLISEVGHYVPIGTGNGPTIPAGLTDPIELTNPSSNPIDISGYQLEVLGDGAGTITIPSGNIVAPNSTFVISRGGGTNTPGSLLNGGSALGNNPVSSGDASGYILSDGGGNVVDVVALNGYNVVGQGSPAATAADWSGNIAGSSGRAGVRRTVTEDNNSASDWTRSSASNVMNIGTVHAAYVEAECDSNGTAMLYAWSPPTYLTGISGNTNTATAVAAPITYTVTAFNTSTGCVRTNTIDITQVPLGSVSINASTNTICELDTTQLTATVSGGVGPFTYSWSPSTGMPAGADTTANPKASPSATTTYTVTATDACSTTTTSSVTITVNPNPVITATATDSTVCEGSTTDLNVTGNADTYVWNPGSLSGAMQTVTPTASTSYTVTGTIAATGCTTDASVPITFIPTFYDTASVDLDSICIGQSVNLIAGDSVPPISYCTSTANSGLDTKIDTVIFAGVTVGSPTGAELYTDNTSTVIPITAGNNYNLRVVNGQDIPATTFYGPNRLFVYIDYDHNGTFGASELVYQTNATGTGADLLPATNITVPATAINGQTRMRVILHEETTYSQQPCGGYAYGETEDYTVNISGGTPPPPPVAYTYTWNPGGLTGAAQTVSPTTTTTYTVTQTDPNGCTAQDSVTVHVNIPSITASPSVQSICVGGTTPATLLASGGSTYTWSPTPVSTSASGDTAMVLPTVTTTYTVTGVDSNGCSDTSTAIVMLEELPVLDSITASPVDVCPGATSTLSANFVYPTPAYCPSTANSGLDTKIDTVIFAGVTTGSPTGGELYTDNTATVIPVTAGNSYNLKVVNGQDISPSTFFGPNNLYVYIDYDQNGIFGASELVYQTTATGTGADLLPATNISIPATAVNGQTRMRVILHEETSFTQQPCGGYSYGETEDYTLNISGGAPPPISYSYAWTPSGGVANPTSASTQTNAMAATTTFTVTATSPSGCSAMDSVTVNVNPMSPAVATATAPAICLGDSSQLNVTISGGGTPYNYSWTPTTGMQPGADTTANPKVAPGTTTAYTVVVTDACSNFAASIAVVTVNPNPVVLATASDTTVCAGDTTMLMASGADTYAWSPGSLTGQTVPVVPTANTVYTVTGTDTATGCTTDATVAITHIPQAYVNASISSTAICLGDTVSLNAMDSVLSYCTSSPASAADGKIDTVSFAGVTTGTSPTATEDYTDNTSVIIPVVGGTSYPLNIVNGSSSGNYYGSWLKVFIDYNQNNNFEASEEVYDFGGASGLNTIAPTTINIPTTAFNGQTRMRIVYAENGSTSNFDACSAYPPSFGSSYGETEDYTIDISGATPPPAPISYTYGWMPGGLSGAQQTVTPTASTTYVVTQTGPEGCTAMDSVSVTAGPTPTLALSVSPNDTVCAGDTITLMSGASGATSYTWNGVASGPDTVITAPTTGMYTVVATLDSAACSVTDSVLVTVLQVPAPTVSTVDPLCVTGQGNITVTAPVGANYQYSIDTGMSYQTSPSFDTTAGTYGITAQLLPYGCVSPSTTAVLNPSSAVCEPNITLGATSTAPSILVGDTSTIDFRINNLGTIPTTGAINVTIGKPTDGNLILNLPAGWSIVANTPAIIQITTNNVIQPGFANSVIIPALYIHNGVPSAALKNARMLATPGSGGENQTNDNSSGIFIQVN